MSSYSTDYSRFKDIVDSDDSDEDKPGEEEEDCLLYTSPSPRDS